ncbi:peptidase C19, ubiquitin C-terminal hydrolase 2 [Scheffersomyces xylosifermentans]|uniref:peptidase C19, ubiquitin C-terminal hydrolase 2 n=1 Tax=Scheffersomyces xylosifermentans TaxID=1304137 RepID=UPI00315CABF6
MPEDHTPARSLSSSSSSSSSVNASPYKIPNSTDNLKSDSESLLENELTEKRHLIEDLIHNSNSGKEGDLWYLISTDYLNNFLHLPVANFEELVTKLGVIDNTAIVDSSGKLYPENEEPVGTYNVSPEIFQYLSDWLGTKGDPVCRCLIVNPETGAKEVERFPPVFYVHQLGKKQIHSSYYTRQHHHPSHGVNPATAVTLSRTKTFNDLLDLIRVRVLKLPKRPIDNFRIWFIESANIEDYSSVVSISNLVFDINNKTLVHQGLLKDTLKSQGVNLDTFHIVVEVKDTKTHNDLFPVDAFLKHVDIEQYDINKVLHNSGHLGLSNLGNTCYMNSALQCLLHVPEVNYYFLYNIFKKELNFDNPLGNHGDVANSFGNLLKLAFDTTSNRDSSVSPREFKSTIGRYSSMFSGYLQQDSQEFLSWLLDALHEDLNRIQKKPYCEKPELGDDEINDPNAIIKLSQTCWNQHKLRNDSVITDLFTGLYQSTLVCPDCSKTSITFDPFNDLTLPLPIEKKWYHTFTIVDLSDEGILGEKAVSLAEGSKISRIDQSFASKDQRIRKLEVELNKTSNYDDLIAYISKFLGIPSSDLFLYEIFRNSFYSDFQLDYNRNKFMPIGDIIRDTDEVHVYYIPHDSQNDIVVPVYNSVEDPDKSYKITETFGIPLFVVLDKEKDVTSFGRIRQKLQDKISVLSRVNINEEYGKIRSDSDNYVHKKHYGAKDFPLLWKQDDAVIVEKQNNEDENVGIEVSEVDYDIDIKEEDYVEDDGYTSDVSLANPYIGADFGFTVKYTRDSISKPHTNFRNRFNFARNASKTKDVESEINVPLHKPNFGDFKVLADLLPELKRNFYHYPSYDKRFNQEMEDLAEEVQNDLIAHEEESPITKSNSDSVENDSSGENFGFVLIDQDEKNLLPSNTSSQQPQAQPPPLPPRGNSAQQLSSNSSDEDTECEPVIGSLFDSTSTLPIPPPSSSYAESLKPSNANSPINAQSGLSPESDSNNPVLVTKDTILLCNWDRSIYEQCFGSDSLQTWDNVPLFPNPELERNREKLERQRKSKVSLYDCLKSFSTPEVLGEQDLWYCPRCKDHKRATKTIQVWSTGDILTIHLKRFHSARAFSDKIDMVVDFPIEGLDISSYVANPQAKDTLYDLIAVDNHYGGLGGGHYTASVRNFRDGKWYYFNDSRVTQINNPEEVITNAAYLLFYRKRTANSEDFLGGENLSSLLSEGSEMCKKQLLSKRANLELIEEQTTKYTEYEEKIRREIALDRELEERKRREEVDNEADDDDDDEKDIGEDVDDDEGQEEDDEDYDSTITQIDARGTNEPNGSTKKARPFANTKLSHASSSSTSSNAKFNFDNDDNDYEYDDDADNIRKQRLLSKENNNNKLVQIKSNGKQEVASSPIATELEYDSMGENALA